MYNFQYPKYTIDFRGETLDDVVKLLRDFTGKFHENTHDFMRNSLNKLAKKYIELVVPDEIEARQFLKICCKYSILTYCGRD